MTLILATDTVMSLQHISVLTQRRLPPAWLGRDEGGEEGGGRELGQNDRHEEDDLLWWANYVGKGKQVTYQNIYGEKSPSFYEQEEEITSRSILILKTNERYIISLYFQCPLRTFYQIGYSPVACSL